MTKRFGAIIRCLYVIIVVRVALCPHKDCQQQVVKQVTRVPVNRAALSPAVVKDYTVMLKHLLMVCIESYRRRG